MKIVGRSKAAVSFELPLRFEMTPLAVSKTVEKAGEIVDRAVTVIEGVVGALRVEREELDWSSSKGIIHRFAPCGIPGFPISCVSIRLRSTMILLASTGFTSSPFNFLNAFLDTTGTGFTSISPFLLTFITLAVVTFSFPSLELGAVVAVELTDPPPIVFADF